MAVNRPLADLPKADLHLHFEGAVRWSTAREYVRHAGLPELPEAPPWSVPGYRFPDFKTFVGGFWMYLPASFVSAEHYRRNARELAETLRERNCRYFEMNFSPGVARLNKVPVARALEAIAEGWASVPRAPRLAIIAGFKRDNGIDHAVSLASEALACREIAGVDLHGADEHLWPPELFRTIYERARDHGLLLKAHAGELTGPDSIRRAVDLCGVHRIGHGVRLPEDPALAIRVRDAGVVLEMCPTSNFMLGIVPALATHPMKALLEAGQRVTVNSDDPTLFCNDIGSETEVLRESLGFDDAQIAAVMKTAFQDARAPGSERGQWCAEVDHWLAG